jgi:DNA-binding transcriptional LysR family regulator
MHQMDWDALQAFLAVARSGRISAAARRLEVEHTTVARRLAALEADLGVPLFYRTTTGYVLTAHGHNALAQAEAMERAAFALAARAREGSATIAGRVRVAMPPEFASDWLAPKIPAFRQRYAAVALQILVGTRQRDLSRGEAELAVQSPRPRHQHLVAARLARIGIGLYASRSLVRDGRQRVWTREALSRYPLLVYTPAFTILQDAKWFQAMLSNNPSIALETNSTHTLVAAARGGTGIAVLPRFIARRYDDLVAASDDVATVDSWLVTHPEFRRDPKVRVVADFLREIAVGPDGLM